jgi:protein AbiQ
MKIVKLDETFYKDHTHLIQAIDNHNRVWATGKSRGHAVVVISINNLRFGVPLRSKIKHKAAYFTTQDKDKGLDFSKALLISKDSYISNAIFKIPSVEHNKLSGKEAHITNSFEKYVRKYMNAITKNDKNILNSIEYRHTTLQNYHIELGIDYPNYLFHQP